MLRERFERRGCKGDLLAFSGVTDCYQPLEARPVQTFSRPSERQQLALFR